ncbi:hypothetical protein Q2T76_03000 [Lactobacillus sp. YT155]|uniref:hypothetical protein n=1 Tax=Lactobacillus sp. YT155 TaxID=3060955 RepID=UPI002660265A|nr:hypothetical protein [Lactobacillus sp. YT155]MDO1605020.1 hypothetical protein [Lactobacillus sp. YT155]
MIYTAGMILKIKIMSIGSSEKGLSNDELNRAESVYNVKFPRELRRVLKVLPRDSGIFYDWGDFSEENVDNLKKIIFENKNYFLENFSEIYWPDSYVAMDLGKNKEEFKKRLAAAPDLIPLFGSRCMASGIDNGPVFSLVGTDIIYYGENLNSGIRNEFSSIEWLRRANDIYYEQVKVKVPFWSDMTEI